MPQHLDVFVFGDGSGEPFRLEISYHSENPDLKQRTLCRGKTTVKADKRTLELLSFFLHNPQVILSEQMIGERIWGDDEKGNGNVWQQVSLLRSKLGDKSKAPRFIETIHGSGYKFKLRPVIKKSAEQRQETKILEAWDDEAFIHFIGRITRGKEGDAEGDLRILTTAFSSGPPDALRHLLDKGVRIRILFVNETLMRARNHLRPYGDGHSPEKALDRLKEQKDTLNSMKRRSKAGSLEVRETNVMPCGFVAHSRHGALVGLFLALESYAVGPMIMIPRESKSWALLRDDWNELWRETERKSSTQKSTVR